MIAGLATSVPGQIIRNWCRLRRPPTLRRAAGTDDRRLAIQRQAI